MSKSKSLEGFRFVFGGDTSNPVMLFAQANGTTTAASKDKQGDDDAVKGKSLAESMDMASTLAKSYVLVECTGSAFSGVISSPQAARDLEKDKKLAGNAAQTNLRYIRDELRREGSTLTARIRRLPKQYGGIEFSPGVAMIPATEREACEKEFKKLAIKMDKLRSKVGAEYDELKKEAEKRVGAYFLKDKWPTKAALQARYTTKWLVSAIPDPKDARVAGLAADAAFQLQQGTAETNLRKAAKSLRYTLAEMAKVAAKSGNADGDKLRRMAEIGKAMNFVGDESLNELCDEILRGAKPKSKKEAQELADRIAKVAASATKKAGKAIAGVSGEDENDVAQQVAESTQKRTHKNRKGADELADELAGVV